MRKLDIGRVVALSWLFTALGATVVLAPLIGLRGWLWLGMHHILCGIGVTHELRRARARA